MTGSRSVSATERPLDVEAVRRDFPILSTEVRDRPLAYLDNAASAQKPEAVIEGEADVYRTSYANVHRGVHHLSVLATEAYEGARKTVASFLGATDPREVVFVRGTTEAINLVARSWARPHLGEDDEVLITRLEHHSNIVPWQMVCRETGARLRVLPIDDRGQLRLDPLDELLSDRTRIVALNHVSNALGTINPVREVTRRARAVGATVVVDGAQAAPHLSVDVQAVDCDFYAVSGHKVYGPSGIGALWGRRELLEAMPPYQGGGEMIRKVTFEETTYAEPPARFEAGTPNIAGAVGFGAALDYVSELGLDRIARHEEELLEHATEELGRLPGVRLVGTADRKASVLSFVVEGVHPHDVGTILDREGIAVRAGHHCAQPAMDFFGVPATVRASFGCYNTHDEVDRLAAGIRRVQKIFA
ncbi:MAG: cysteine desulfurase [Thermoanaerobaculia bacterium]|nr:cysteine desulfurase [Thermoanaerobaculia bacterium]